MALEDLGHPALGLAQIAAKNLGVIGVGVSVQELDRALGGRPARERMSRLPTSRTPYAWSSTGM